MSWITQAIMNKALALGTLALFSALPSFAANDFDQWVGVWRSKDAGPGPTLIFSALPDGRIRESQDNYKDAAPVDLAIDGKPHDWVFGTTITWTATGDNTWNAVVSARGKEFYRVRRELSANGKILTDQTTGHDPDGTPVDRHMVLLRISGTTGWIGEWRELNPAYNTGSGFTVTSPGIGILRWDHPEMQGACEGKPNGADSQCIGSLYPPGFTISYTLRAYHTLSYVTKISGKPVGYGIRVLAPDGKSLTEVSWFAGDDEHGKKVRVYLKQ